MKLKLKYVNQRPDGPCQVSISIPPDQAEEIDAAINDAKMRRPNISVSELFRRAIVFYSKELVRHVDDQDQSRDRCGLCGRDVCSH